MTVLVSGGIFYLWTTCVSIVILKGYPLFICEVLNGSQDGLSFILDWEDVCLKQGSGILFSITLFNNVFWYFSKVYFNFNDY